MISKVPLSHYAGNNKSFRTVDAIRISHSDFETSQSKWYHGCLFGTSSFTVACREVEGVIGDACESKDRRFEDFEEDGNVNLLSVVAMAVDVKGHADRNRLSCVDLCCPSPFGPADE